MVQYSVVEAPPVVGLCLAAPHATVLLCTAVGRAVALGMSVSVSVGLRVADRIATRLEARGSGAVGDGGGHGGAPAGALVGRKVEADEEEEIAAQNAAAGEGGELFAGTPARVGHPRPVGGSEVGVGRKVDESCGTDKQPDYARHHAADHEPRSTMNCRIWRRVIHCFHQTRTPRADWK